MRAFYLSALWVLLATLLAVPALAQQPPLGKAVVTSVTVAPLTDSPEPGYEWGTQLSVTIQATVNTDNQALLTDSVYGLAVNNPANNSPFPRLVAEFIGPELAGGARWKGWLDQPDAGAYVERCVTTDAPGTTIDYVAFSSARDDPNGEIYYATYQPDGAPIRVTNRPNFADREPSFSPGAARIAFTSSLPAGAGDIFVVRPDGSQLINLTNSPADDRNPAWSPDGSRIAFTSNMSGDYDIYIITHNPDGTWSAPVDVSNSPGSNETEPAWYYDATDGKYYLAFTSDLDGDKDVWVLDVATPGMTNAWNVTGYVNPLTGVSEDPTAAPDYSPTWSPDTSQLAFVSERDGNQEIYRIDVILTAQTASGHTNITTDAAADTNPKWAKDNLLFFDRDDGSGNPDIYQLDPLDTGLPLPPPYTGISQNSSSWDGEADFATMTPRLLTLIWPASAAGSGPGYTLKPSQGPDGKWGAYDISERADNRFGAIGEWKISRLSLRLKLQDGSEWLDYNGDPAGNFPVSDPPPVSASKIAFASNRDGNSEIYSMDPDGSNQKRLTFNSAADTAPSLSPNGQQIAFVSDRDNPGGPGEIYLMNSDGTGQRNLTNNIADDITPCWSPDGHHLAFASNRSGSYEIWVMNSDGSNPTQITTLNADSRQPTWFSDGQWLAFASNADSDWDIYKIQVGVPSSLTNLTNAGDSTSAADTSPTWSPDGSKIAFNSDRDGNFQIYVMNSDGTNPTNLSNNSARDQGPCWSPDGSKVAFASNRDGNSEIYWMNSDGSNQTRLTNNLTADLNPSWSATDGFRFDINNPLTLTQWDGSVWQSITDSLSDPFADANRAVNGNVTILPDLQIPLSPHGATESIASTISAANRSFLPLTPSSDNAAGGTVRFDVGEVKFQPPRRFEPLPASTSPESPPLPGDAMDMVLNSSGTRIDLAKEGKPLAVGVGLVTSQNDITASITPPKNQPPATNGYTASNPRYSGLFNSAYVVNLLDPLGRWFTKPFATNPEPTLDVPLSKIMPYLAYFYVDVNHNGRLDTARLDTAAQTRIAFHSGRGGNWDIYVMNADGTNVARLTNSGSSDLSPSWSPDGSKIAFQSDLSGDYEIYTMNADGTNWVNLTNNPGWDENPSWSPDGSKIAFDSRRDGNPEIYVMNADGSNQIRLTNNPATDAYPSWSPDGSKILFTSERDLNAEIYVMNADGTNQTDLTNNLADDVHSSWSPDGSKIAFASFRTGGGDIYVMNADGTNQVWLTNNPANDDHPCWSLDGSKIVFDSNRDIDPVSGLPQSEIYAMDPDGSNQTNLTNNAAHDEVPSWGPPPLGGLFEEPYRAFEVTTSVPSDQRIRIAEESVDLGTVKPGETYVRGVGGVPTSYALPSYSKVVSLTLENVGNVDLSALDAKIITPLTSNDTPNTVNTRLAANLLAGDTTMTVEDASRFPAAGQVLIDSEQISFASHTGTTIDGLTRGINGTIAADHSAPAHVSAVAAPPGASLQATVLQTWMGDNPEDAIPGQAISLKKTFTEEKASQVGTYDVTDTVPLNARISIFVPPDQPAGIYRGNLWVTWWDPIASQWVRKTDKPVDVKLTVTEADAPGVNSPSADLTPALFRYYNSGTGKQELSLLWASNRNDIAAGGTGFNFDIWSVVAPWDDTTALLRPLFAPTLFAGKPLDIQSGGTTAIGNFASLEPYASDPVSLPGDPDGWYLTYYQNLYPSFAYDMAGNPWIFWQLNTWWQHKTAGVVDNQQFRCYLGQAWYDGATWQTSYLTQNTGAGVTPTIYHEQPVTFAEGNNVWSFWNNGLETDRWLYFNYYAFTPGVGFAFPTEDKPLRPMAKYDWTQPTHPEVGSALNYAIDPSVFDDSTTAGQNWGVVFAGFSKLGQNEEIYYMRLNRGALSGGGYDPSQIWDAAVSGRVPFETQNQVLQPLASSAIKDTLGNTHYKTYAATNPDWLVNNGVLPATILRNGVDVTGGAGFAGAATGDFTFTDAANTTITVDPAAGSVAFENTAVLTQLPLPGDEIRATYTPLVKRLTTGKANDNSPMVTLDVVPIPDSSNGSRRRLSLFWRSSVLGEHPRLRFKTYSYDPSSTQWVQDPGSASPYYRDSEGIIPISGLTDQSQIFAFPNWDATGTYADRWWLLWTSTHEKTLATFEPFGGTFAYPYASNWDIHYTTFWPNAQPEVSIPPQ